MRKFKGVMHYASFILNLMCIDFRIFATRQPPIGQLKNVTRQRNVLKLPKTFFPHMRKHKAKFPYSAERDKELLRAFRSELSECRHILMDDIYKRIVKRPCSRFWVTEERAAIAVSLMLHGERVCSSGAKLSMFREIFRRYLIERARQPGRSMASIVERIVNSPAPEFYISPSRAKSILLRARKLKSN